MNQTSTDYLFQAIATGADRVSSATSADDQSSGFGDHLSYASTSALDALRPVQSPIRHTTTSTSDARDGDLESNRRGFTDKTKESTDSTPSSMDDPTHAGAAAKTTASEDERGEKEETRGDEAAEVAAAQAVSGKAAQNESQVEKDAVASEADCNLTAQDEAKAEEASSQLTPQSTNGDITPFEVVESNATTDESPVGSAKVESGLTASQENDASSSKAKRSERRGALKNGRSEASVAGTKEAGKGPAEVSAQAATDAETAPNSMDQTLTMTSEGDSADVESADDTTKSSDADSRRSAKAADRESGRDDSVASANKSVGPPIVNAATNIAAAGDTVGTAEKNGRGSKPATRKTETAIGPLGTALRAASERAHGGRSTGSTETPQVDPARFVGRVAKAFHTAQERGGALQLRLSPPELGSLKLQLTVKDGVLSAALETDNAHARRVLLDHLPALRDRLAEQNIRIERFDVEVQQENNRRQADPRGSNQNPYQQQPEQTDPRRSGAAQSRPQELAPTELPTVAARISTTGINLVV